MALAPDLTEQELLADTHRRLRARMTAREVVAESLVGAGFIVAIPAVWAISPPSHFSPLTTALFVAVLVLALRVRFETPLGFTVPSQLAFVPLLFVTPLAIVPVAVAVSIIIDRVPIVLAGEARPSSLLRGFGNCWFAVGPVLVFALAHVAPSNAGSLLLAGALAAQFAGDFLVSAVYFAIARGASLRSQLRESWVYVIDAGLSGVGLVVAEQANSTALAVLSVVPLLGLLAMFAGERQQRLGGLLELNETYRGTALLLGDVISADDGYTGEHCQDVVALALAVGDKLGLQPEQRRNLEFGALLHDVGKIAIPKEIINKPSKLDPEEWALMKTHTIVGEQMLARVGGFMLEVGQIVRSHHERWDGAGYPDRLAADEIPLSARIIACCDAWNAMRTHRSYRRALPYDVAMAQLLENSGTQFDPAVVTALVEIVEAERTGITEVPRRELAAA